MVVLFYMPAMPGTMPCGLIQSYTGTIAPVTTNHSGRNCRRTGSCLFNHNRLCGRGKALPAGVAQAVPLTSSLPTVKDARRRCVPLCRLLPARSASPPGGILITEHSRSRPCRGWRCGVGARSSERQRRALTCCARLVTPHGRRI
jgi:hypothetical protein